MAIPSSSTKRWTYDVFLNFRGQDTRNTFTSHLHQALCDKGINTFIDDRLERGDEITPALLRVIEESRISIVVFSKNYVDSDYCLDELVKIIECNESKKQLVLPVFYNVDPSDVEEQKGSYGLSRDFLGITYLWCWEEKIQEWKEALTKAARLSGWHLDNGNEAQTIQSIVEKVLTLLNPKLLHVAGYPVALDSHILHMNSKLSIGSNDVRMIGIWGIGGIGKTTIAKAIYNIIADQFEGCCFLANVREMSKQNKVVELQQTLLSQILGDKNWSVGNADFGINVIKDRLCSKKVLIVIDDVDNVDQLEKLAGELDWFGAGTRIIITSRDEHLLVSHGVKSVHKVEELRPNDALLLFSWNAFRKPQPTEDFMELSHSVVKYAKGLPLALVVLGSFLRNRSACEWQSELEKLKRIPNKEIYEILKISYDGLEDNEKAIFLDIACFFRGMDGDFVTKILHACDFNPVIGIKVLAEKSLISIENDKIQMHDLLQAIGREVVQQESPKIPGRRSRLWFNEDVLHVLTENTGTEEIEGIMLDLHEPVEINLSAEAFQKMKRLRILLIRNALVTAGQGPLNLPNELRWLEWPGCPLSSMPSTFQARKLVVLSMQRSFISQFERFQGYHFLKFMDLRDCKFLTGTPDFSSIPNLERLNLEGCINLVEVHQSVGFLRKLEYLSLEFCSELRRLPSSFRLKSLATLLLTACKKLEAFPDIVEEMPCLEKVCLSGTAIKILPPSIKNITGLKVLTVTNCKNLANLPSSIYMMRHLERLLFEGCSKLVKFPVNGQKEVESSSEILLSLGNSLDSSSSSGFPTLKRLDLRNCNLVDANFLKMHSCFPMLKELDVSGNNFNTLPAIFSAFTNLKSLKLSECHNLKEIPELPQNIRRLEARGCKLLERYPQLVTEGERPTRLRFADFSNCHKLAKDQDKVLENALLSKGFFKNFQREMFLPGSGIPQWFAYSGERGCLNFQVPSHMYEKIKGLVFCIILCSEDGATANISCEIFINGQSMISCSRQFFSIESDHLWFCYQPFCFSRGLQPAKRISSVHFEISFEVLGAPKGSTLKTCGVHLKYKQDKMMNDAGSTRSISRHTESVSIDLMRSFYKTNDASSTRSISHHKESVSIDLMRSFYKTNDASSTRSISHHKESVSIDLMRSFYIDDDMKLELNPRKRQAKQQSSLIALKSGEHQQEQWLSLSLQPFDQRNSDKMSRNLQDEVQLQMKRKQKLNLLESCTSTKDAQDKVVSTSGNTSSRMCRNCNKEAACILLLPCRHLCLCSVCEKLLDACPICRCIKSHSVSVYFS